MVTTIVWNSPIEIAANGDIGGLVHYYTEQAQLLYVNGDGEMQTRVALVDEGNFEDISPDIEQSIYGGDDIDVMRFDHPCFGQVFGAWCSGGTLICALYSYAADVSDIVNAIDIGEQVDNTIRSLALNVKNADRLMFDNDLSLFCPGAAVLIEMTMGSSAEWYPMGRYYLDKAPYDSQADSANLQGRSRVGRLLKDVTFDVYGGTASAQFTGTPDEIVTEIMQRYSDGEITAEDIIVQTDTTEHTVEFPPNKGVLAGLSEWLAGKDEEDLGSHETLEYGDTGSEVELAQELLNKALPVGYTKLVVDGVFGRKTKAAVQYVQQVKGIPVTGQVDAATWAVLLVKPLDWQIYELYDGRFVVGQPAFIAAYRPIGRYTFTRGTDVITRSVERCADGSYARVGVKYKSSGEDAYAYATVDMWPAWAIPSHKTYYLDAPDGASAAQAQTLANNKAVELQYVGVTEQVVGLIRPELVVGDIAQIDNEDGTATVTGIITELKHKMGIKGFFTTFATDSGGAIMEDTLGEITVEVSAVSAVWGGNRQRRVTDVIRKIAEN